LIWRGITPARLLLLMGLMLASDCVSLLMSATGVNLKWSPTSVYGAFFCIGILFHLHRTSAAPRKALRDLWPFWIATIVIASIDAVVDFRWTEVGMLAQSPPAWWSGPLIAMVIVSIFGLFIGGTSVAPLSRLFRILGMASYPLYLLHQQFGYWSIRLQEKTLGIGVQAARLVTILAMVGLATAFSMFVEPVLMRAYARTGTQLMNRFKLRTSGQTAGI
jgi:peptidoglycan/LPS O-acetylase OafA/YrhL